MPGVCRSRAALASWLASIVAVGFAGAWQQPALAVPLPRAPHLSGQDRARAEQRWIRLHPPPPIAAAAAELVNMTTGRRLWSLEQDVERPIASLTKVMTALVVVRAGNLDRRIRITQADEDYLGCCIQGAGLIPGDVLTARQLLYAALLPSGADAALALADSYGPGWRAFVRKMDRTARELHLTRTHFTSFDGVLPSNVSTPADLMRLGEAAMRLPAFRAVVKRPWFQVRATRYHHYYFWRNRNLLLGSYSGALGIKTGWIPASGECLLFAAQRGTRELVGVVLDSADNDHSHQTFYDAETLLNWGFEPHN